MQSKFYLMSCLIKQLILKFKQAIKNHTVENKKTNK